MNYILKSKVEIQRIKPSEFLIPTWSTLAADWDNNAFQNTAFDLYR